MMTTEVISLWKECEEICNELELKIDYYKNDYEFYVASRKPYNSELILCKPFIVVVSANTLWHFHTALCLYYFKNKPDGKYISNFTKATLKDEEEFKKTR